MACKICGNYSGFYPLCNNCFKDRDLGLILKCEDCNTWYRNGEKCKCEPQECIICGKTQNKSICKDCYKIITNEESQIDDKLDLSELNELYYQTKFSSQSIIENESFNITLFKLNAIANIIANKFYDFTFKNKIYSDIKFLKDKREDLLKNRIETKEEESENGLDSFEKDYRKTYPTIFRCNDGHYVRSKSEREIDNFLYDQKIWHEYEKEEYDASTKERYYIDFYLPEYNIFIEHFGLTNEYYLKKAKKKTEFFERNNETYIITSEKEANNLNDILKRKIKDIELKQNIKILTKR